MALPNKKTPFDSNISSKKLNTDLNFTFDRGWSPILAPVLQTHKVVLKIQDWIGGEGDKPYDTTVYTYYLGATGLVTDINDAVNIAEDFITSDWLSHIIEESSVTFILDYAGNNTNLKINYTDLKNNPTEIIVNLFNDDTLDFDEIDHSGLGMTRKGIQTVINKFRNIIISNDSLFNPGADDIAPSQSAVINYIEEINSKFDTPLITLTTSKILEIENSNANLLNPYYAVISTDERKNGFFTLCTEDCNPNCCDCPVYGYEEMGNRKNITGELCTPTIDEVNAVCKLTVTNLGNVGDRYELWINNEIFTYYIVEVGDTTQEVINGLIANIQSTCACEETGCPQQLLNCTVDNITSTTFDIIASSGLGSIPNSWTKTIVVTGTASATIVQIIQGIDYQPPTYRGIAKHMIVYNGTDWFDLGMTLSATLNANIVGTKYYIENTDNIIIKKYSQYIIYHTLIVDGIITLENNTSQIIIL